MIRRLLRAILGQPAEELHPEDVPNAYDVAHAQAIQDADDFSCALTRPAPARTVVPELPADQWERIEREMQAAYDDYRTGGGLPGETRTTWTREDYRS